MGRRSVVSYEEPDWVKRGPEPENEFIRDRPGRRPTLARTLPKAPVKKKPEEKKGK